MGQLNGSLAVTHDPRDPSKNGDPFDPWSMTHWPISISGVNFLLWNEYLIFTNRKKAVKQPIFSRYYTTLHFDDGTKNCVKEVKSIGPNRIDEIVNFLRRHDRNGFFDGTGQIYIVHLLQ